MYDCEAVRRELSNLVEDQLEEPVRAELERHLSSCRTCRVLHDSVRRTLSIVSDLGRFEIPPSASEPLFERIREAVRAAAGAGIQPPPAPAQPAADGVRDEASRLAALAAYEILDSGSETPFDDLVALAARICDAPMAAISLVDADRQWFKARIGLDVAETARDVAFCAQAILGRGLMVVPDATADARFAGNPLVTGEPGIRFYAGAPLHDPDGHALGTLCVLDRVARDLSPEQAAALEILSREVVSRLELRRTSAGLEKALEAQREQAEALRVSEELKTRMIECSRDCVKVLDLDGALLSMNAGGMQLLEICDLAPFLGGCWIDFWKGEDRESARTAVEVARNGGIGRFVGLFETLETRTSLWFDVIVSPMLDSAGRPDRLLAISRDITERKRSEDLFRKLAEATAVATGEGFFRALVETLAAALRVPYVFVTECTPGAEAVRMLACWQNQGFGENLEYGLAGTPCQAVVGGEIKFYSDRLQERFPDDVGLVEWGAQSFLGLPLRALDGAVIGHLAIMGDRPLPDPSLEIAVLRIFADRAAAELERLRSQAELERLKDRLQAENVYLQEEIRTQHNFEEIIGNAPTLVESLSRVERVAATDSTVLIVGETGTGKELFARAVHSRSPRRQRPLVKVNCGAIPAGLVESELFGHVRGAFTGALDRRVGRFELADGGTIFLDEIGELPHETQVKLLRVLQEREFEAVGSSRTVRVDVRVIAATNRDLESEVRAGRFRADLLYRLNVFPIAVPPLRERREDVPLLAAFFLSTLSKRIGKSLDGFSRRSMQRLGDYPWPGNIRELQNVVERAAILAAGPVVEVEPGLLAGRSEPEPSGTLEDVERRHISSVLRGTRGVIEGPGGAARILGLHPNTLRSRMKKLGVVSSPSSGAERFATA
jgi:formate hydrogenlyase transcriptional activator